MDQVKKIKRLLRKLIIDECKEDGYGSGEEPDIEDFLLGAEISSEHYESFSWGQTNINVSEIAGRYFRYVVDHPNFAWDAIQWETIEEVVPYTETITVTKYKPIK